LARYDAYDETRADFNPDCVPPWRDSETQKTLAKRAFGVIL